MISMYQSFQLGQICKGPKFWGTDLLRATFLRGRFAEGRFDKELIGPAPI